VSAGELVLVVAAVLCSIGFAALIVVLLRVLDTMRDVRREVDQLRMETTPLIRELLATTDEARATVDEARADLERFDRVLGSAEAIGDAVGGRVARTSFSAPMIKATSFARGTSRTISRLRGGPRRTGIATVDAPAIERTVVTTSTPSTRWSKRA
jgi:hypothetical protein